MNEEQVLNFTATEFSSVNDKMKFYRHFIRFVESDFNENLFYKWFYTRLSLCFGHIAHYNKNGFYQEKFSNPERKVAFMANIARYPCYGQPDYTFCDVERALISHFNGNVKSAMPLFQVI